MGWAGFFGWPMKAQARRPLWPLDRRQSLLHSDYLLQRWAEQIEVGEHDLDLQPAQERLLFEPTPESYLSSSSGPDSKVNDKVQTEPESSEADMAPAQTSLVADESQVPSVVADGPLNSPTSQTLPLSAIPDNKTLTSKVFRVGMDDPCYKVLPYAVREYSSTLQSSGYPLDWRHYALCIGFGDQERALGLDEKPLAIFKDLDRAGKKPMFMLRKIPQPEEKEVKSDAENLSDRAGISKAPSSSRSPFVGHTPTLHPIDVNKFGSDSPKSPSLGHPTKRDGSF